MRTSDHQILDSRFVLHGGATTSGFFERMERIYDGEPAAAANTLEVHVHPASEAELLEAVTDWSRWRHFHRSLNYAHWNLEGPADEESIFLPGQGMLFRCGAAGRRLDVYADASRATRTDELVVHAARNLALWRRGPRFASMLHASAVVVDGVAWLFMGDKGAGKSTLFIDSVLRHGATPLANDRVLLDADDGVSAWSWPSYLSYCEGTILDYPELLRLFRAAAPEPLYRRSYEQKHKRIVPPFLMREILGRGYARRAPVGGVIRARLQTGHRGGLAVLACGRSGELQRDDVAAAVFGAEDPDFPAWHGARADRRASEDPVEQALRWLRRADVPFLEIVLDPAVDKPGLGQVFRHHNHSRR